MKINNLLFPNLISKELYEILKLNDSEMNRRRFLLGKDILNAKEIRELQILDTRCFLQTVDFIKQSLKLLKNEKET